MGVVEAAALVVALSRAWIISVCVSPAVMGNSVAGMAAEAVVEAAVATACV